MSLQTASAPTLAELFDEFDASLHRYAVSLVRNRDWADDLVQETFIRAWGHLALLGLLSRPQRRAWLQRVLKNVFIDQHRRTVRERAAMSGIAQQQEHSPVDPARTLQLEELFATLPEALRSLWYRRYVVGMNAAEIAHEAGIPHATVRTRLHTARTLLRRQLERYL